MAQTLTREGVGIGWRPELSDHRDYIFEDDSKHLMRTMTQLAQVKQEPNPELLGPRRNQHAEGSCVGHGTAAAANRITRQDDDRFDTVYSPRFLYNMARILEAGQVDAEAGKIIDPGPALLKDNGAYVRDGVLALRKFGTCPESNWKYRAHIRAGDNAPGSEDYKAIPTSSRIQAAHRFRVVAQRCTTVEGVLSALAAGFPVVYGTACFTGWWTREIDRTGLFTMPSGRPDGGHCMCGMWFNTDVPVAGARQSGVLWSENSWSAGWAPESPSGIAGVGGLPIEFIRRQWADDLWCVLKEDA